MKSYSQALKILKKGKINIQDEYITSTESLNRVCSENIYSHNHYPSGNNSSFDGYAINSIETKNLNNQNSRLFKILGTIAAGDKPKKRRIKKFQTYEIMTGALLPKGFDAIIPIEQIIFYPNRKKPKFIKIHKKIKKDQYVRLKGSDYKKNDLLIKKGTILKSSHILALKTLGIHNIRVKKIPNILFFSTGNEIEDKSKIPVWKVRNSNLHYMKSLSYNFFFNFKDGGILRDTDTTIFEKKIKKMLKSKIDIIITSGAVSAGKFDYIPKIINKFKLSNYFKNVAIRPGKPFLFAKIKKKQKVIFGVPGNPISSAACFRFFIYIYLKIILGIKEERPIKAVLKNSFSKKISFTHFTRSKINTTKNGKIEVKVLKGQESFRVQPFTKSNTWAVFPSGKANFKKGEIIDCFFQNNSNKILD